MLAYKVFGAGANSIMVAAICTDTQSGISAAGTTQATATALNFADNEVTTVAAGAGVVLYASIVPGDSQTVFNAGANALKIYPPLGMNINALQTNAPMLLATNTGCIFKCITSTRIFGILSA